MPGKTLVVLGSGPGIGVQIACTFSVRGFTHIALVSRNQERLEKDWDRVLDAVQERGYSCQVKKWVCDLSDLDALNATLKEIERFGSLECVLFNAARVAGRPPLDESLEEIERDFRVGLSAPLSVTTMFELRPNTDHQSRLLRYSAVGNAIAQAGSARQSAVVLRDKHVVTVQGTSSGSGLVVYG